VRYEVTKALMMYYRTRRLVVLWIMYVPKFRMNLKPPFSEQNTYTHVKRITFHKIVRTLCTRL